MAEPVVDSRHLRGLEARAGQNSFSPALRLRRGMHADCQLTFTGA